MNRSHAMLFFSGAVVFVGTVAFIARSVGEREARFVLSPITGSVLGQTSPIGQTHFDTLTTVTSTPTPSVPSRAPETPTPTPTPTPSTSAMEIIGGPEELIEGDIATFTWYIGGPAKIIHTTTIYYGTTSAPGGLGDYVTPADARYTYHLGDFLQGDYTIPLQFIGNIYQLPPGTYFYRAYAFIDGKHYWSDEHSFVVKPIPKHEIRLEYRPGTVSSGANVAFTWDVYGPTAITGYTVIVGGKQSKPGMLDATVDISRTPYTVMVPDFTNGTYNVPLRFIGNTKAGDAGVYYYRALAFINGKNIWSDEYSFTVQ